MQCLCVCVHARAHMLRTHEQRSLNAANSCARARESMCACGLARMDARVFARARSGVPQPRRAGEGSEAFDVAELRVVLRLDKAPPGPVRPRAHTGSRTVRPRVHIDWRIAHKRAHPHPTRRSERIRGGPKALGAAQDGVWWRACAAAHAGGPAGREHRPAIRKAQTRVHCDC